MRIAIGPFRRDTPYDLWPLYGSEALAAEGFDVASFGFDASPPEADVLLWWSPEYAAPITGLEEYRSYKVAFVGDWHIRVPDLSPFDLVVSDWRGVTTDFGADTTVPLPPLRWWRGFSFDPRLHYPPTPDTQGVLGSEGRDFDVAFLGRPTPHRDALRARLTAWADNTRHSLHFVLTPYERGAEASVYRRAKVVLGDSQRGELQMRAYEAMACGALYVAQHDCIEASRSGAPIPTYDPAHLEDTLGAWLDDAPARAALVAQQQAWVQRETPARHLRWLCQQIKERMNERDTAGVAGADRQHKAGGGLLDRGAPGSMAETPEPPPLNEQRPEVCALVPPDAKTVLDVGCDKGGLGWGLKQERPGVRVVGIDANPAALDVAATRLDATHAFNLLTPAPWDAEPWVQAGAYDAIVCADVLEHVIDPWALLGQLKPLLAPGGVLVASIPQVRNVANLYALLIEGEWRYHVHGKDEWRGPHDNVNAWGHLRYFTRQSIARLFADAGFDVVRWAASHLAAAPGLAVFVADLTALIERHGGAPFSESSHVIQWLCVATAKETA